MTLTPADLERIEARVKDWNDACRNAGNWAATFREAQAAVWDNREALLALARRALELESALAYLETVQGYESEPHVRLVHHYRRPGEGDASPHPNAVLSLAKILGWPGLQSEGGKEQGEHG